MKKRLVAAFAALLVVTITATDAGAADDLITKPSAFSVGQTLDRLEKIFAKKGITIFARVNHTAGAEKISAKLRPTEVIVFGNPKIGTPLMQSNQLIGIDLPLKVLAWQDDKGKTWIAYNDPQYLAKRHGITDKGKVFAKMAGALNNLTDAAIKKK